MKPNLQCLAILAFGLTAIPALAASYSTNFNSVTAGTLLADITGWDQTSGTAVVASSTSLPLAVSGVALDFPTGTSRGVIESATITLNAGENFTGSMNFNIFAAGGQTGMVMHYANEMNYAAILLNRQGGTAIDVLTFRQVLAGATTDTVFHTFASEIATSNFRLDVAYTSSTDTYVANLFNETGLTQYTPVGGASTTNSTFDTGRFGFMAAANGAGFADNFAFNTTVVPEPSGALLGGLGVLGLLRRRRI